LNQLPTILKKARQALDLTQEDVAKRLGISQRAYAFYEDETNERIPKPKRLAQLGEALDIPIKTLMKQYGSGIEENNTAEEVKHSGTPDLPTLLSQLMQKQNQLMEMQNKILAEQKEDLIDKVKEIHINSKSTIAYLQTILRVNRADDAVIMDNQDAQAGREVGSSAMQAGNLEIAAAQDQVKKDKRKQDGVRR
jgi:transcriptional regulator with XRE-family HTH domain